MYIFIKAVRGAFQRLESIPLFPVKEKLRAQKTRQMTLWKECPCVDWCWRVKENMHLSKEESFPGVGKEKESVHLSVPL